MRAGKTVKLYQIIRKQMKGNSTIDGDSEMLCHEILLLSIKLYRIALVSDKFEN